MNIRIRKNSNTDPNNGFEYEQIISDPFCTDQSSVFIRTQLTSPSKQVWYFTFICEIH